MSVNRPCLGPLCFNVLFILEQLPQAIGEPMTTITKNRQILRYLKELEASNPGEFVNADDVAAATELPLLDVEAEFDALEADGRARVIKTRSGMSSAILTNEFKRALKEPAE